MVLQEFIPYEGEAGIFYVRRPGEAHGRITSRHPQDRPRRGGRRALHAPRADPRRPARGARAASLSAAPQGPARRRAQDRRDGAPRVQRQPLQGLDLPGRRRRDHPRRSPRASSRSRRSIPDFHFGRIDLRFASIAALRKGEDFRIIEINGVGSEATHIWDPDCSAAAKPIARSSGITARPSRSAARCARAAIARMVCSPCCGSGACSGG